VGRDKVLRTALQLFMRHGYVGTSMRAIAEELGISAAALYWYFPSKEEIFASVLEMSLADFWSAVKSALTEDDPVRRLGQLVRAHVSWQLSQSDVARTFAVNVGMRQLVGELPEERAGEIIGLEREYLSELRGILDEGKRRGQFSFADVKVTAFAVTTMCEYVHTWFNPGGEMGIEDVAAHYEKLALAMVGVCMDTECRVGPET
jgi:AcrR family transcriptional regulator